MSKAVRGLTARQLFSSLADAYSNHFKPKDVIVVDGKERTAEWLAEYYTNAVQTYARVELAKAAHAQAIKDRKKNIPAFLEFAKHGLTSLEVQWGSDPEKLTKVGIPAKQKVKRERTAEQKFLSAEKAKATREARGTMGKRQKAQIKGAPVEVIVSRGTRPDAMQPPAQQQPQSSTQNPSQPLPQAPMQPQPMPSRQPQAPMQPQTQAQPLPSPQTQAPMQAQPMPSPQMQATMQPQPLPSPQMQAPMQAQPLSAPQAGGSQTAFPSAANGANVVVPTGNGMNPVTSP